MTMPFGALISDLMVALCCIRASSNIDMSNVSMPGQTRWPIHSRSPASNAAAPCYRLSGLAMSSPLPPNSVVFRRTPSGLKQKLASVFGRPCLRYRHLKPTVCQSHNVLPSTYRDGWLNIAAILPQRCGSFLTTVQPLLISYYADIIGLYASAPRSPSAAFRGSCCIY